MIDFAYYIINIYYYLLFFIFINFDNAHLPDVIPQFSIDELGMGKVLGKGGFGTVS